MIKPSFRMSTLLRYRAQKSDKWSSLYIDCINDSIKGEESALKKEVHFLHPPRHRHRRRKQKHRRGLNEGCIFLALKRGKANLLLWILFSNSLFALKEPGGREPVFRRRWRRAVFKISTGPGSWSHHSPCYYYAFFRGNPAYTETRCHKE